MKVAFDLRFSRGNETWYETQYVDFAHWVQSELIDTYLEMSLENIAEAIGFIVQQDAELAQKFVEAFGGSSSDGVCTNHRIVKEEE